jgi:hypothetical protein
MGEHVPYTSYLKRFIKKLNFCNNLNLLKKKCVCVQVEGLKTPPLKNTDIRVTNLPAKMVDGE